MSALRDKVKAIAGDILDDEDLEEIDVGVDSSLDPAELVGGNFEHEPMADEPLPEISEDKSIPQAPVTSVER